MLGLLIPIALAFPLMALAAEGTSLSRYRGTPMTELLALIFAIAAYTGLWVGLNALVGGMTGLVGGIIAATIISSALSPLTLFLGFKIFGVRPGEAAGSH